MLRTGCVDGGNKAGRVGASTARVQSHTVRSHCHMKLASADQLCIITDYIWHLISFV